MKDPVRALSDEGLPPRAAAAASPLRATILGLASGIVAAAVGGLVTLAHLMVLPRQAPHLELLSQYFPGYHVSPAGVAVGAVWGFVGGFVAGWLLAFVRNLVVRAWLDLVRTRGNLGGSGFLDDI